MLPLTISNGPIDSTINIANDIRLYLSDEGYPIRWTSITNIDLDDTTKVHLPPLINTDSTQLIFTVKYNFQEGDSFVINNLQVTGLDSVLDKIRFRINVDGLVGYEIANAEKIAKWWDSLFEQMATKHKSIHRNSSKFALKFNLMLFLIGNRLYAKKIFKPKGSH